VGGALDGAVINCKQLPAGLGVAGDRLSIPTPAGLCPASSGEAPMSLSPEVLASGGIHPVGNCPAVGRTLDGQSWRWMATGIPSSSNRWRAIAVVPPIGAGGVCVAFGGVCVAFVAFALPKRHTLKALWHKGLRRVWRLWRLFSTLEGLKEEVRLIVRSPVLGSPPTAIVRSTPSRRKSGQLSCRKSGRRDMADQTPHMPHMPQSLMA